MLNNKSLNVFFFQVIGVKKLRIVDASVMPSIPTGHVNLPTIAIAEKIADVIKDEWDWGQRW